MPSIFFVDPLRVPIICVCSPPSLLYLQGSSVFNDQVFLHPRFYSRRPGLSLRLDASATVPTVFPSRDVFACRLIFSASRPPPPFQTIDIARVMLFCSNWHPPPLSFPPSIESEPFPIFESKFTQSFSFFFETPTLEQKAVFLFFFSLPRFIEDSTSRKLLFFF